MSDTTPEHKQPEKKPPEQPAPAPTSPEKVSPKRRRKKKVVEEKDVIPNMELVVIFIFFATFIVWAVSKCTVTQASYEEEATIEETIKKQKDSLAAVPKAIAPPKPTPAVKKTAKTVIKKITVLYVVLNGLKLRKGPTRDSMIVRQLKINEPVDFLGDVTPFKEKINMGDYIAEEPWVKVRSSTGVEGWVYGAGVSYYPPVIEEEVEELRIKNE